MARTKNTWLARKKHEKMHGSLARILVNLMGEHRVRTHWPKPVSTETYIPLYIQKEIAMCHGGLCNK